MTTGSSLLTVQQTHAAYLRQTGFSIGALWAKLHVGDPGKVGTANPAGNTVRVNASACFGTDGVDNMDGTFTTPNDAEIGTWEDVSTAETYTHVTFWDDETAGDFRLSGVITSASVAAHDTWKVPIGDCRVTSKYAA